MYKFYWSSDFLLYGTTHIHKNSTSSKMPTKLFKTHKTVVLQKLPSGSVKWDFPRCVSVRIISSFDTNSSLLTDTGWLGLPELWRWFTGMQSLGVRNVVCAARGREELSGHCRGSVQHVLVMCWHREMGVGKFIFASCIWHGWFYYEKCVGK